VAEHSTGYVHEQKEEEQAQDEEGPAAVAAGVDTRKTDLSGVGEREGREGGRVLDCSRDDGRSASKQEEEHEDGKGQEKATYIALNIPETQA